ncbi:hypothetical protein V7O66_03035 [Methanolobus sp. ZRKC3]|uniref:hypothetical protein n=1 Tax=Methanolobus sp. ZRKC3 TaxID=3125786 RepID=UPI00324FD59C
MKMAIIKYVNLLISGMHKFRSFIFVFFILLSISNVHATNYNLEINSELVDNYGTKLNVDKEIQVEQNLAIHFSVVNKNDLWINVRNLNLRLNANKDSERFIPISSGNDVTLIEELLIPPESQADFYIVLEKYNSLNENDRIGSWVVSFETTETSSNSFSSLDLIKENYLVLNLMKPNNIEFRVIREQAQLDQNIDLPSSLSYENLAATDNIVSIIGGLILIIGTLVGIVKVTKGKSKK